MNKTIFIILASFAIVTVIGETCSRNPLAGTFGFTPLPSPQTGSGHAYCNSLKTGNSCCSDEVVNNFQTKADELIARLNASVYARDQVYITMRKTVLRLTPTFNRLKRAIASALTGPLPAGIDPYTIRYGIIGGFEKLASVITDSFSEFKANFSEYQKARTTCINEMVKTQASAWCLACDPNFDSKGIVSGQLILSGQLQQRILNSCFSFLSYAASQNVVLSLNYMSSFYERLAIAIEGMAKEDPSAMTNYKNTMKYFYTIPFSSNAAEIPVEMPSGCKASSCPWLFQDLFVNGILNETLLVAGGKFRDYLPVKRADAKEESDDDSEVPVIGTEVEPGTWNPDSDEAGVNITFLDNVGSVDINDLSGFCNGVFASLVVLFIAFIL